MARPRKEGMDYFPHDTDASSDEKVEAMRALFGNDGYAFYFILCERIYRTDDAELDISKRVLIAPLIKKLLVTQERFEEMLDAAFELGLFDRSGYEERQVITSKGIKKRFGEVQSMRERWRNKKENKGSNGVFSGENRVGNSVENLEENAEETGESKAKQSKEKKNIKEYRQETIDLTNHLIEWMKRNNPNAKVPTNLDKWYDAMDKLERIDNYEYLQIRSAIDWCQQDDFWKANILSAPKLREKMNTIILQMQRKPKLINGGSKVTSFSKLQQLAKEEEEREASGGY